MHVLYEDNHLLAVAKPPGLPTQGALAGRDSLVQQAKEYLRRKYQKPGNVYLGVVSRLDSPTSGVVIFARTSKAAARLNAQFRGGSVKKLYWAIVEGLYRAGEGQSCRSNCQGRTTKADGRCGGQLEVAKYEVGKKIARSPAFLPPD